MLLPGSATEHATSVAERIRVAMEQDPVAVPSGTLRVTVSVGVAEFGRDGSCLEDVIKAADERIYRAKAAGRNRVVS